MLSILINLVEILEDVLATVCGLTFLKDGEKRLPLSLSLILSSFPFHETR